MEYKFKIGDSVRNSMGATGTIISLVDDPFMLFQLSMSKEIPYIPHYAVSINSDHIHRLSSSVLDFEGNVLIPEDTEVSGIVFWAENLIKKI